MLLGGVAVSTLTRKSATERADENKPQPGSEAIKDGSGGVRLCTTWVAGLRQCVPTLHTHVPHVLPHSSPAPRAPWRLHS